MNIIDELKWRGAVNQQTDEEGLYKLVGEKSISLYCGIDPTGDSMHIGHLIPFMILKRFQLAGHHPVIVIGGGTGSIGDPSGRKTERVLQSQETIQHNAECLTAQMKKLFGEDGFTMVNNYDWLSKISLLEFLRDYGKLFNINTMLARPMFPRRLMKMHSAFPWPISVPPAIPLRNPAMWMTSPIPTFTVKMRPSS
jgi:tyrosyl-tRNA synthetase